MFVALVCLRGVKKVILADRNSNLVEDIVLYLSSKPKCMKSDNHEQVVQ